jgi:hypothetical protein
MNDINVRELRIFEILKETAKLFRSAFRLCLPLCLLAFIPGNIMRLFLPREMLIGDLIGNPEQLRYMLIIELVRHIFTCLVVGGYTYLAMSNYVGKPVTVSGVIDFAINKWIGITLTGILFFFIIAFTSVMIFPMIYFAVLFVFHRNIAAVSGERGFKALAASAGLVRGFFFKRLLYGASFLFMYLIFMSFLSGIIPLTANRVTAVAFGVVADTLASVFLLAQAVWFVNILLSRKVVNITV